MMTLLLSLSAFAAAPNESGWQTACTKSCVRTGFQIEVLENVNFTGTMVRLWDINAHEYIDDAHYQSGDVYLGVQSSTDPLVGGPYCSSYPGAGGHLIQGNVYDRVIDYAWEFEETSTLHDSPMVYCDADFPFLLDTLELYGVSGTPLPSSCTDIGCATGGGPGEPGNPGSGGWEYTDAAGNPQSFDDLVDDDPVVGPGSVPTTASRRR